MTMTVAVLAIKLEKMVQAGYGACTVSSLSTLDDIWVADEITAEPVHRDEVGFWTHPAHPVDLPTGELAEWLDMRGLTFTLNYLLEPEDDRHCPEGDYSLHELRVPAGNWFLWMISANSAGDCVALWVAPTK